MELMAKQLPKHKADAASAKRGSSVLWQGEHKNSQKPNCTLKQGQVCQEMLAEIMKLIEE